jgi:hypothetical protein
MSVTHKCDWEARPAAGVGLGMDSGDTFFTSREEARANALRVTEEVLAYEQARQLRDQWLAEHPGRTAADYKRGLNGEVLKWRRQKAEEADKAERAAWLRDHPGSPLPEHFCSMREFAEYEKWSEERGTSATRPTPTSNIRTPSSRAILMRRRRLS